jgi:hypothetical protein
MGMEVGAHYRMRFLLRHALWEGRPIAILVRRCILNVVEVVRVAEKKRKRAARRIEEDW